MTAGTRDGGSGDRTPTPYHPPVKRSIEIAGHKTSISLEPLFWDMLRQAATVRNAPINALVARIDADRLTAPRATGLASAIRVWLAADLIARSCPPVGAPGACPTVQ